MNGPNPVCRVATKKFSASSAPGRAAWRIMAERRRYCVAPGVIACTGLP